jgi:hypothetical protein
MMPNQADEVVQFNVQLANTYAVQAMMCSNAYQGDEWRTYFSLEDLGWKRIDLDGNPVAEGHNSYEPGTWLGRLFSNLQFDVWENQKSPESIIAFKGTDEKIDWLAGNLALGVSIPCKSAKKHVRRYVNANPGRRVSLTGHSLGGGLALSVSGWEGLDAVVFNTSPRIFDGLCNMNRPAIRKAIFQADEVLQNIRRVYPKFNEKIPTEDIIQTSFDFHGQNLHRMDLLAEGILRSADSEPFIKMAKTIELKVKGCS